MSGGPIVPGGPPVRLAATTDGMRPAGGSVADHSRTAFFARLAWMWALKSNDVALRNLNPDCLIVLAPTPSTSNSYHFGVANEPSAIVCTAKRLSPTCAVSFTIRLSSVSSTTGVLGCGAFGGGPYAG